MVKRIRLITGVILFAFLTCHLINLSFGLISLDALDSSRLWVLWFWSTGVGLSVLVGSMVFHLMLGLFALYNRNTLRMSPADTAQLLNTPIKGRGAERNQTRRSYSDHGCVIGQSACVLL